MLYTEIRFMRGSERKKIQLRNLSHLAAEYEGVKY